MGRLKPECLERVESWCDRIIHVARELQADASLRRVVDQIIGCGTSVGADVFEADEAMSRKDFAKCLCIAVKECNEAAFWLRLLGRHNWVRSDRLQGLLSETGELKKVMGAMIGRSLRAAAARP